MQITQNVSSLPVNIAPASPNASGPTGESSPFAKMLSAQKQPAARPEEVQGRQGEAKSAEQAGKTDTKTEGADDTTTAQATDSEAGETQGATRRGAARNSPRLATRLREDKATKAETHDKAGKADTRPDKAAQDIDKKDPQVEPNAAELAAQMNRPVAEPAHPVSAGHADAACDVAQVSALSGVSTPGVAASAVDGPEQVVAGTARGAQDSARIEAGNGRRDSKFSEFAADVAKTAESSRQVQGDDKLVGQKDTLDRLEQRIEQPSLPSLRELAGTSHVGAAHAPTRTDNIFIAAYALAVAVATPVTSPEFNQALGVQVSVLARDGVQHAELHLNPTDMGPISVQIALEGTRAQVDFGADSFATRQIIESGLPELASARRDAGFTLAGGGVSQLARGQQDREGGERQPGQSSRRMNASGDVQAVTARRTTVKMSQGGVDLYA